MLAKQQLVAILLSVLFLGGCSPVLSELEVPDGASPGDIDADVDAKCYYFNCYEAGACLPPALSSSASCLRGRDYDTSISERSGAVVVLSIHGGLIERGTSEISSELARRYAYSHYDFNAHGTPACLQGQSDIQRLHISANHFDDPEALGLLSRHSKAVALHGYTYAEGFPPGSIFVGGENGAQRRAFTSYINQHKSKFTGYELAAVPASTRPAGPCGSVDGNSPHNVVNRVSSAGGLQLETSQRLRDDLQDPSSRYGKLRDVFYGAIGAAMR